ncbi:MAG: 3-methyl-2-oxobutanoate hydroxymethyltransferase, partial [Victivallales bacterium]|nr:3-methyl-2-oxobutanoate hydroxymethyltransferase [Victivallales bacterium]
MEKRITVRDLAKMKAEGRKITTITSYDAITARLVDEAGIQLILVGDSAGNTVLGYENTIPVTLEESLMLTAAVRRGAKHAMVIGDMPFMSYQVSEE